MKHYDIGIVGWWSNLNYGGTITYYALNTVLRSMGKSVLMIQKSSADPYRPNEDTVPYRFAKRNYEISTKCDYPHMIELNELCDTFVVGSDQLWNPYLQEYAGKEFFLSFVDKDKRKVSYATSFGNVSECNQDFIDFHIKYMKNMDFVSVREDYAVKICKENFGIEAEHVCDPVFLCNIENYENLADKSTVQFPEKYVLNFILDPDKKKLDVSHKVRNYFGIMDYVNLTDLQNVDDRVKCFEGENVFSECEVEDFIKAFRDSEYVVTDSFHGTCLAIIFNKQFISLANFNRGEKRFISLLKWTNLEKRLLFNYEDNIIIDELLSNSIDYSTVNSIVDQSRKASEKWLKKAISFSVPPERSNSRNLLRIQVKHLWENSDFVKVRMLGTLLKDYGIRHIVVSPGGRDVPLVRMIEYNQRYFVVHRVVDERSAAYYGLGIAAQLHEPVACVCTSGTAASNYLPAVTEAYYTGIPMIMITADRYNVYHGQGEDQTTPQRHIFKEVTKSEITVPEGNNYYAYYQARRDIQSCILEATHNGCGPVHINIAIENIGIGAEIPADYWSLLPRINPHILRTSLNDTKSYLMRWVEDLKKANKILLVYGQNPPTNDGQLKMIEMFSRKFNCVVVTDFISNLSCDLSVKPYNMLQSISQKEFDDKLTPDILISVGGKRLMNDPLTFKIRGGKGSIRHWLVTPDGKVKDFYFRLTSVLEMSQDAFFEFFTQNAGDVNNNMSYYSAWKSLTESFEAPLISRFNGHYVQSKFIPAIPEKSMLHLGVGQSFYDSRRYRMNPSVEVFCNMGTNGIDGCTSTFMGQCAVVKDRLCFLLVGDLSFFYDMNGIWNMNPGYNIRILMVNNNGTDLLRGHGLKGITSEHNTTAKGWVESCGFKYISAKTMNEFDELLHYFVSSDVDEPLFFEVFCE